MAYRQIGVSALNAANSAASAGLDYDGADLTIRGNLALDPEKVIKMGTAVTIGYEAASDNVQYAGKDLDINNNSLLNDAAGGGGSDGLTLDIGTSSTTFPSFAAADGDTSGSIMNYLNTTTTKGDIYYLNRTGPAWTIAQANAASTADGLLTLSVGTNSDSNGMMVQGYVRLDSGSYGGTPTIGDVAYLSDTVSGLVTFTIPATSGDIVRAVGHCVQKDGSNHILLYFNPSPEFTELA